jgi:hypothetical protein
MYIYWPPIKQACKQAKEGLIMRKAKYLSAATIASVAAAVIAAMTVIVSCSAADGSIDSGGDDGTKGLYTIAVAGGIQNGSIKASRSAANAKQQVTVEAVPAEPSGGGGVRTISAVKNSLLGI